MVSAFGAIDFLMTLFSQKIQDVSFTKALEKWFSFTNARKSHVDGTQKIWTQPVYVKAAQDSICRMDDKRSKFSEARQGK